MQSATASTQQSRSGGQMEGAPKGGTPGKHVSPGQKPGSGKPDPESPPLRFGVIWRLGKTYFGKHPTLIAGYITLTLLCNSFLQPAVSARFGKLTNATIRGDLKTTYLTWVALTIAYIVLGFGLRYLTAALDLSVGNALRRDLFARILRQGPRFFHDHDEGELTMIVNQTSLEANSGLRHLLVDPTLQVISIMSIGSTLYLEITKPDQAAHSGYTAPLFILVALAASISPWLMAGLGRRLRRNQEALQSQGLGISSLVTGAVKAPEEIQAMRAEDIFDRKHSLLLDNLQAARLRGAMTLETLNLCNRLPGDAVLFTLLGIAVFATGGLTPGTLVAVALLTSQFMNAVQQLSGYSISVSMGWPAINLINTMLGGEAPSEAPLAKLAPAPAPERRAEVLPQAAPQPAADPGPPPVLEVTDLQFSYLPGRLPAVLDHVSFAPPPGRITGLVALAGQGKTTFFRLALRFYEQQAGIIRLDGVPHTDLPLNELRRRIVLMAQFPAFFSDTVRENLLLAKPDATDAELRRWAEMTGIWRVLEHCFPEGDPLDAPFHSGMPLSGGQRKLFALTRCLLRNPDFLFLDEPTTGMDPETKFDFIPPMRTSCAGKTVLVVDHDILWQLRFCDHFLVLDHGKIIEAGPGKELLARHGLFRSLFDEQTRGMGELLHILEELDLSALKAPAAA